MAEIVSLAEAVERAIHDGDAVAMEGFTHLIPFAAGHEVIRQRRRDLTLIRMTPDLIYDQLIGAGCARKLIFSWGGNPGVGSLHRFRDAVEHSWPVAARDGGAQPRGDGEPLRGRRVGPAVRRAARLQRRPAWRRSTETGLGADDQADHLPVHRRDADRGRRPCGPTWRSSTPSAPTGPGTSSSGGSPACRRKPCSRPRRSVVTVEEIVDELDPAPGRWCCPAGR